MKRTRVIVPAVVVLVVLGGIYFSRPGQAPPGQPPLVDIDSQTLSGMQAEFNRTAADLRVILLLSPT